MMNKKQFSGVRISAVAAVTPEKRLPLIEFSDRFGEKEIERIMAATGIQEVTVADESMTSSDYAYEAALHLLRETGTDISSVDGLLFLTESPDYIIPNTAAVLQDRLGMRTDTINMDLRYGCAGYVYGLFQASLLVSSGCCEKVLLLAGDTVSRYINSSDRSLRMVNGDAACATLIERTEEPVSSLFRFFVDGSGKNSLYIPAGGCRTPHKAGVTDVIAYDEDGNGRTQEDLYMNGMDIVLFAIRRIPGLITGILEDAGWTREETDLFALHQANKLILDKMARTLKIPAEKVPICLRHTGNCGFDSIPLMLCTMFPGVNPSFRKVVACGFGAGLIAASAALDLSKTTFLETFSV